MKLDDKLIKKVLLDEGYVSEEDLDLALEEAKKEETNLLSQLYKQELITKDIFGQAMSDYFKVSYADLNSKTPVKEQILKIPKEIAQKFRVVLFLMKNDKDYIVATDNPSQKELLSELKKIFPDKNISVAFSLPEDISAILTVYRQALDTRFVEIIESRKSVAPEIIDEIFEDALTFKASDIHFDSRKEEVIVRFRIDGILQEAGRIPKKYYENILNRIKVQSNLRIDEHFATQDGAIRYEGEDRIIDMRVSIAPTMEGEKIVIRLLAQYTKDLSLNNLGLSKSAQDLARRAARKPFGMILAAGPTGSGKTTTLYSLLKILNNSRVNITTIEDPVEYKIKGLNQIQVNSQTGLTFSRGLRSIVRQDPDVILVGEIRDEETAEISVNAALTGHLLFSTFHANNAATVVPRLLDMGIEPFLLASTLEVIIAQRLVRKICEDCRYSISVKTTELKEFLPNPKTYFPETNVTIYKGKGCPSCADTGYSGRTGIFEFIEVTNEMEELIMKDPSTSKIWNLAKKQGSVSFFEDGIEKVKKGVTTMEELTRVALPPKTGKK